MKIKSENLGKEIAKIPYDKPSFKKYGNMKHLVFGSGGSGGDGMGSNDFDSAEGMADEPRQVGDFSDVSSENSIDFSTVSDGDVSSGD